MPSTIDLHIHTSASDGADAPAQLARKVKEAGLRCFAVTDHDTIAGALKMERLVPEGVRYIRGVEFSCVSPGGKCHILGYGYDPDHPAFRAALAEGRELRLSKLRLRVAQLREKYGVVLTDAEEEWLHRQNSPGKPHLGRILVDRGLADSIHSAIKTYLGHVPGRDRIEARTAIEAINAAGGLSVWAHPLGGEGEKRISREKFADQLAVLRDYGLAGLECWYSRYSLEEVDFLRKQAETYRLTVTGGSDYHGQNKPDLELGQLNSEGAEPVGLAPTADQVGQLPMQTRRTN